MNDTESFYFFLSFECCGMFGSTNTNLFYFLWFNGFYAFIFLNFASKEWKVQNNIVNMNFYSSCGRWWNKSYVINPLLWIVNAVKFGVPNDILGKSLQSLDKYFTSALMKNVTKTTKLWQLQNSSQTQN